MIWDKISAKNKPFFALAPMNDVTDSVFRQIIARCTSPDVFFTEFVSVDSLSSPGRHAMDTKLAFSSSEQPLIVQVWGNDPKNYEIHAAELSRGGYAGIDINMGCPVAKIISKGSCSALIKDRGKAHDIIAATQAGAQVHGSHFPVSVKTRIGYDKIDLSWIEFLLNLDLDGLIIHCRTTLEQSKVPNHFEVLPEIVEMRNSLSSTTKLVANGDITTREQGNKLAGEFGLDGIMIGRGVFLDPFVFSFASPWSEMPTEKKLQLFLEHIDLFDKTWNGTKNADVLKRFAKTYVVGFPGAPKIRDEIMGLHGVEEVRAYLNDLIEACGNRVDTH